MISLVVKLRIYILGTVHMSLLHIMIMRKRHWRLFQI